jgi:fructose/tagatose bisphosphate aldolase
VDVSVLKHFSEMTNWKIPLVLHGTSGLDVGKVRQAIQHGVRKINFSTDLKAASFSFNQSYFSEEKLFDELDYLSHYKKYLSAFFEEHIESYGRV